MTESRELKMYDIKWDVCVSTNEKCVIAVSLARREIISDRTLPLDVFLFCRNDFLLQYLKEYF